MRLRLPPVRLWVTTLSVGFLLGGPEQADLMPYPLQCSPRHPHVGTPAPRTGVESCWRVRLQMDPFDSVPSLCHLFPPTFLQLEISLF